MQRYILVAVGIVALAGIAAAGWSHFGRLSTTAAAPVAPTLLAAPVGVTFQELRAAFSENDERRVDAQLIFADHRGMTVYFNDHETATAPACDSHCGEMWKPLAVVGETAGVVATWTAIARPDGTRQWAFRGKPLYTYAGDARVGDTKGDKIDGAWHVALFNTVSDIVLPYGFGVIQKAEAAAETLVDGHGMTLYWSVGAPRGARCFPDTCVKWVPVVAGELDRPTGDFSLVAYDAGVRQWAYQDHPLYTYTADKEVGDVHGASVDPAMQVAETARYYMPAGIAIRPNVFGGVNVAKADGTMLYLRNRQMPPQGHSLRAGIRGDARIGRALGIRGCEGDCLKERPPLVAPADFVAAGYWDAVAREDGTRQWTYRGFPLYTYTGDHTSGDMSGNEIYDVDPPDAPIDVGVPSPGGVGFLSWLAVVP